MATGQIQVDPAVMAAMDEWETGDIIDFEETTGCLFGELVQMRAGAQPGGEMAMPFKPVLGMAWIMARHTDPDLTWEQAKRWKLSELQTVLAPTAAALQPLANGRGKRGQSGAASSAT